MVEQQRHVSRINGHKPFRGRNGHASKRSVRAKTNGRVESMIMKQKSKHVMNRVERRSVAQQKRKYHHATMENASKKINLGANVPRIVVCNMHCLYAQV